jgi:hypothetical protein
MTTNILFAGSYSSVRQRIQQTDIVTVQPSAMLSIPANANPFHHDSFSMGSDLPRGWMVMHAGFDDTNGFEDMYLVNTKTGQRIQLDFEPETPQWEEAVYIDETPELDLLQRYCWVRQGGQVFWYNYQQFLLATLGDSQQMLVKPTPLYMVVDKWMVLMDVLADHHRFARFCASHEPDLQWSADTLSQAMRLVEAEKLLAAEGHPTTTLPIHKLVDIRDRSDS